MAGFSFFSSALARWGATRGPPYPLRGCLRARALEWESWISLRRLLGDSNTVVSLCWGLGGLRHFRGALRPSRHISRGLPTGSEIRCHSRTSCAGAYDSGLVGPRLHDVATGYWGSSGFFCSAHQDFGMLRVFCARFPAREASNLDALGLVSGCWGLTSKDFSKRRTKGRRFG